MEFRIYDRQTLAYKDGGYVASYTIDDDYIVNNNSTITIVKALNDKVVEGDPIVLIQTSGVYHKGIINTFDNSDLKITYKSDKELFNNNMLNPQRADFIEEIEDGERIYTSFGLDYVSALLKAYFSNTNDIYRKLPLKIYTEGDVNKIEYSVSLMQGSKLAVLNFDEETFLAKTGGITNPITFNYNGSVWVLGTTVINLTEYGIFTNEIATSGDSIQCRIGYKMIWNWEDDQINIVDWLIDLFERYNVIVKWNIDFDISNKERHPYYIVTISAPSNSPKIIKDNVDKSMQIITYTEEQQPEATVCTLIDQETKEIVQLCSGINLLNPNLSNTGKFLSLNTDLGLEEITDDIASDISNLIRVNEGNSYTFSCNGYDNKSRYIIYYKSTNEIATYLTYNLGYIINKGRVAFTIPADSGIKFVKICYYTAATELQFQEGNIPLPNIVYDAYIQPAIYYLCEKDGNYYVSLNQDESEVEEIESTYYKKTLRVLPSKMKIVSYNSNGDTTPDLCAKDALIPSKFNQAIEVQLSNESRMFDFTSVFGDYYKIINQNGIIESVYSGRKETSENKWVTLYFGLGRQRYTDLNQIKLRKNKYQILYNKGEPL